MVTMNKENNASITANQLTCMLIMTLLGTEVLFFPNLIIEKGKQDAWICAILGGIYPIFMVRIAAYMCKKFPQDNILKLSKRFLGKFLGSVLNVLFLVQFIIYSAVRSTQLSDLIRLFISYFLTQRLALTLIVITVVYSTYKGVSVLGRANEVIYYFTIIMVFVPLGVFSTGNLSNLLPVFNVSKNPAGIAMATVRAGYDYFGVEIIFLLYPYLKSKGELLKAGLKASLICIGISVWFTFAAIYYYGIDIMPKYLWIVVECTKAFRMVTIKNFTFIFIFFWVLIVLNNISNNYFSSTLILNELWRTLDRKKYTIIIAPIVFYIALKFGNETTSRAIMSNLVPSFTVFNIIYASVIALIIRMRRNITNEDS